LRWCVFGKDKYHHKIGRVAAMNLNESDDELTGDDENRVSYRDRAAAKLDDIAREVKQALVERGFALDIFFLIPRSGDAIILFGTPTDPSYAEWESISEIVSDIVRRAIGLDRSGYRSLVCAMTPQVPASVAAINIST
jgi:hypothetical protein